jgi:hypothetical protein
MPFSSTAICPEISPKYAAFFEAGSSVSIVSDCDLNDRVIEVRSRQRRKDFSSNLCDQTRSRAHSAFCTMETGDLSAGLKRGRGVKLTTHHHLVPRL